MILTPGAAMFTALFRCEKYPSRLFSSIPATLMTES